MGEADVCIAGEFFPGPYAAYRVVGRAEEGELYMTLYDFFFQIRKIHFIMTVLQHQRAVHQLPSVFDDRIEEGIVYRLVDEDAVSRFGQGFDSQVDGRHDAGGFDQPFRADGPVEIGFLPGGQGFEIGFARFGIAEDAMVHPLFQGVQNGLCNFEIHVGYPEGKHVFRFSALHSKIVFQAAAAAAVNDSI